MAEYMQNVGNRAGICRCREIVQITCKAAIWGLFMTCACHGVILPCNDSYFRLFRHVSCCSCFCVCVIWSNIVIHLIINVVLDLMLHQIFYIDQPMQYDWHAETAFFAWVLIYLILIDALHLRRDAVQTRIEQWWLGLIKGSSKADSTI